MGKLATLLQIGQTFGVRDGALRLGYEAQRGSGWMLRRMQSVAGWERWSLKNIAPGASGEAFLRARRAGQNPFFFQDCRRLAPALRTILGAEKEQSVYEQAEDALAGRLPFFGSLSFQCGFPPDWFRNPATGQQVSPQRAWTTMRFASQDYGDLKFILEPSRFLFVYPLVRAYALSGDERYAEGFWILLEDWARNSPPMAGPLWICGQESSLRILAWTFALHAFLHSPATTPERATQLLSMIAAHAWRTEQTLSYARSQRSNHLVSEAVGLWTVGTLYPELKNALALRELGHRMLREAVRDQIALAGDSLQDSFNYQRMVVHLLLWTLRLAEIHGLQLDSDIRSRTSAACEFMRAFVDAESGHVPNHGSNDGSHILPLSSCDYSDFRPTLQVGATVLTGQSTLGTGLWDEAALWLCGKVPPGPPSKDAPPSPDTGYYRLGTRDSWAMVRAARYHRRPAHADQLHVELWWRGVNLARDAGTYLYNGEPPWNNGFAGTAFHNTVTVDQRDQMRRAGRFLWVDWAQASGRAFAADGADYPNCFEGEHDGYKRYGVTHRRKARALAESGWVIVDDLIGTGEHEIDLHWLLPDSPVEVISQSPWQAVVTLPATRVRWSMLSDAPSAIGFTRAGECSEPQLAGADAPLLGWESPTYGEIRPAISLLCRTKTHLPVRLVTVVLVGDDIRLERTVAGLEFWKGNSRIHQVGIAPPAPSARELP